MYGSSSLVRHRCAAHRTSSSLGSAAATTALPSCQDADHVASVLLRPVLLQYERNVSMLLCMFQLVVSRPLP